MIHRLSVVLALCAAALPQTLLAQASPPAAGERAVLQFEHLSVEVVGRGDPVILIPGLASPRAVWDGVSPELAKRYRVYRVQVNGFGGDDPRANLKPGVLDGIVADLASLIQREGMVRPAVVGHSLGGLAAMLLAAGDENRVGRVMVVDALPFIGTILAPGSNAQTIRPRAEAMRAAIAATHGSDVAEVTTDPGGIWSNTPAGRIQVANWSRGADQRVVAQAMFDDMTTDATPLLPKIAARPFTVLYAGGAGPMAQVVWEAAYAGSGARLETVPDSLHFIMLDQPAAFAAALDRFLTE